MQLSRELLFGLADAVGLDILVTNGSISSNSKRRSIDLGFQSVKVNIEITDFIILNSAGLAIVVPIIGDLVCLLLADYTVIKDVFFAFFVSKDCITLLELKKLLHNIGFIEAVALMLDKSPIGLVREKGTWLDAKGMDYFR